jgi:hypothetical protein
VVVTYFKALSHDSLEEAEENNETFQPGEPLTLLRFVLGYLQNYHYTNGLHEKQVLVASCFSSGYQKPVSSNRNFIQNRI